MNIRQILKRDIGNREHLITQSEQLIKYWRSQLANPLPRKGIDYAHGLPDLGRLKAAGNTFVCRYLGGNPNKDLTSSEAYRLSFAGFDIVTVFEAGAENALGGGRQSYLDARLAAKQLHDLGAPPTAVVYFACDWEVKPSQYPVVRDYFQGALRVLGHDRVGIYGGYEVVHELMSLDNVKYGWQTYAWSAGRWSPHAQLRQIQNDVMLYGVDCDLDRAMSADFGQWRRT